ncbi:MAG: EAL domain-containing protein [Bauldia sp.]
MGIFGVKKREDTPRELPAEIYISVVDSLYSDAPTLFVGSLACSLAALVSAVKTGRLVFFLFAVLIALLAAARAIDVARYGRRAEKPKSSEAARQWETRYTIGASAYVSLLGLWCIVAFATSDDPFVRLAAITSTTAYMVGISGRNFGSSRLVVAQLTATCIPMTLAFLSTRDVYYAVYAILFMAFFLSLNKISDRLRDQLFSAVIATRDVTLLAKRFDTALNNMPHGLAMFDASHRLVVANGRLSALLSLPTAERKGMSARQLLLDAATAKGIARADAERTITEFEARLDGSLDSNITLESPDGRSLDITFQQMENRGSVVLIEDITERRIAEAKIKHMARYDTLTGLPNRSFFHDHMERALTAARKDGESCAVLFVDLDQFKQVNDTLGHPCGDELLCAVAARLRGIVRQTDIVARFGGDEFVVLQSPVTGPDDAAALARRIVEIVSETFDIDGHQVVIGASVGIAMGPGEGGADLMLKNADMALYRTKADGRGTWRFFEPEMDVKAQARRSLELDLRAALANDAFDVYYQPLIDLGTRKVSTCEALLRWPHPERGMVSPAEFVPVAEEMGIIVDIGNLVLRRACAECLRWPDDVRVAVNFSPIQFRRGAVIASIRKALAATGLPANRLEVEITESVLLQDTQATRAALMELREMGVRISLDDFGTGYSSLSYLHSFPLHKVKIDRSFVQGLGTSERSLSLLRGVTRLSAELGMSVAVEGIETEQQLALISSDPNVNEAQGFLFSRAVSSRNIRQLLGSALILEKVA